MKFIATRRLRYFRVHEDRVEIGAGNPFPKLVRDFWQQNYLPYRGSILVAGRRIDPCRSHLHPGAKESVDQHTEAISQRNVPCTPGLFHHASRDAGCTLRKSAKGCPVLH